MNNIYWSSEAKDSYAAILNYLMDNFSLDIALNVDDKVESLLANLEQHKFLCPASENLPFLRRCVITKNLSLTYRVLENDIELVVFYDSRTNHIF